MYFDRGIDNYGDCSVLKEHKLIKSGGFGILTDQDGKISLCQVGKSWLLVMVNYENTFINSFMIKSLQYKETWYWWCRITDEFLVLNQDIYLFLMHKKSLVK